MIKKTNGLTKFLLENLEILKKYQNEIAKNKTFKYQNKFTEGLKFYEKCLIGKK